MTIVTSVTNPDLEPRALSPQLAALPQKEWTMARWAEEQDEIVVREPIQPKKDCQVRIEAAEAEEWIVKEHVPGEAGKAFKAMKLTLTITDEAVQTEHENAQPRRTLDHHLNLDRYPFLDKKSGTVKWMGRQGLYGLEEALGFDPIYLKEGQPVEAYVTRTGQKRAPKGEGITRQLNPAFVAAYFHPEGTPNLEWANKTVYADIGIEKDEQYGDKNRIVQFKAAPVLV